MIAAALRAGAVRAAFDKTGRWRARGGKGVRPRVVVSLVAVLFVGWQLGGCAGNTPGRDRGRVALCRVASDCPASRNPCLLAVCEHGVCDAQPVAAGSPSPQQTAGDCRQILCGKGGLTVFKPDPSDIISSGRDPCTEGACAEMVPTRRASAAGKPCGDGGVCDGLGSCRDCIPGDKRCEGNVPRKCTQEGTWADEPRCEGSSPVCSKGACASVVQIAAGSGLTCALIENGAVMCWGDGSAWGSVFGVREFPWVRPTVLSGLGSVRQVALGAGRHGCAVQQDGAVICWGVNDHGQVGRPVSTADVVAPFQVLSHTQQVAVGLHHSCSLLETGSVVCWGANDQGQLGNGTMVDSDVPVQVGGLDRPTQIALGSHHACALIADGRVMCWGSNRNGEAGANRFDSYTTSAGPLRVGSNQLEPVLVDGVAQATEIALAGGRSCARTRSGTVPCWGGRNFQPFPREVEGLTGVEHVAVAPSHACALVVGHTVRCWGANPLGQLGDGTTQDRNKPTPVIGLDDVAQIAAGSEQNCAQLRGGSVTCWGWNGSGKLGDGTRQTRKGPVGVAW